MKDPQARLARTVMVITWFFMIVVTILLLLLYLKDEKPVTLSPQIMASLRGKDGANGADGVVDWNELEAIIDEKVEEKVASIPRPKDGAAGKDGANGSTPVKGIDYDDGKDGVNGVDGRERIIRFNAETRSFETQLAGDEFWEVILDVCSEFPIMCKEP